MKKINFFNKTYKQLIAAYMLLKERYKRTVVFRMISVGSGLYKGYFSVR